MAKIEQLFELQAKFESMFLAERSVNKLADSTDRQIAAGEKLAGQGSAIAASLGGVSSQISGASTKIAQMSDATKWLVDELGVYQNAIRESFTDSQKDKAIDQLLKKMERVGLVFTSSAAEVERFDLVARSSLEDLARSGDIAANSMANIRFNDHLEKEMQKAIATAQKLSAEEARAAQKRVDAELRALQAFAKAQEQEEKAAQHAEREKDRLIKKLGKMEQVTVKVESRAVRAVKAFMGFGKASNPVDKLSNRLARTVVTLFSVRRVLRYITEAMERAPDRIATSFNTLGRGIKDGFARVMVSAMGGMQSGVDKLNAAMNSKAGQTFFRGLERAAQLAGNAIGKLLEGAAWLVEFLGSHAQEVFTVAAISAGFFAAQMLIGASASFVAAAPILLIVGLIALLVVGLNKLGVTSEEIFYGIGATAGWLYALCYNLVADFYNVIATFAEFFANVFNDPVAAVAHLFFDTFDVILSMVETAAKAIDLLTGSKLATEVSKFRSNLQSWADRTFGENEIKLSRMEKISYLDTANAWGNKASDIASSFSLGSLGNLPATEIKSIKSDTSAIRKAVILSKEDLKSLVDIAERRFINQVNLTTLRPIINVNGANTGRTEQDRLALANAIKEVLLEEVSSGSTVSTVIP